jgi:hypothetical protein
MFLFALFILVLNSCYRMRASRGGGQVPPVEARKVSTTDVLLHPGYEIAVVAEGLTFPTSIAFDGSGTPHVVESGYGLGPSINANPAPQFIKRFQVRLGLGQMPAFDSRVISKNDLKNLSQYMKRSDKK